MNLRNKRDFCANHQMIQDTHAVFVPILKKQGLMLRELLEISNLPTSQPMAIRNHWLNFDHLDSLD